MPDLQKKLPCSLSLNSLQPSSENSERQNPWLTLFAEPRNATKETIRPLSRLRCRTPSLRDMRFNLLPPPSRHMGIVSYVPLISQLLVPMQAGYPIGIADKPVTCPNLLDEKLLLFRRQIAERARSILASPVRGFNCSGR